ncbi:penicillin-binding protein [Bacillus tianshenii]|uniref:serine-type D-Ala-D-Ala carboxypeptidase n=1 Tax=Sutcliffiella tianshenii TaxID=1463404 RepID=A0ABS2NX35_9BACI|nr:penicillin-binding transpeptidase domain-containing protein [Bacillus tianshenii]MBM7619218.1 penicillin-binding protein [Bacillus tianshenii]
MKKVIFTLFFLLMLSGCQEEKKVSPYEILDEYIGSWNDADYQKMYDTYLTDSTKETYGFDVFSERYEKLYGDLEVSNLKVEVLDKDVIWEEKSSVTIPGRISFDTYAGNVQYKKDFVMERVIKEEEPDSWNVQWDPSYILPELELTDKVRITTTSANRGEILDSEGNPMAQNAEVSEIGVVPGEFDEAASLSVLAGIINMDEEYIKSRYTLSWAKPDYVMPVKKFLLDDEETVNKAEAIPGVRVSRVKDRIYPYGEAAAHLIGYIGEVSAEDLEKLEGYAPGDKVGKRGLEQLLEERLRAQNGEKIYLEKEDGSTIDIVETPAQDGENVQVTINAAMQQKLYETLKEESGIAAVVEPNSGKVRSLVSLPSFNPNDYVLGITSQQREALENNPEKPTVNRFSYTYSPGSTMKLITSVIGLENESLDPNKTYDINTKEWKKDESWGNYTINRVYGNDTKVDLESGLKFSDNIYFAQVGLAIGEEKFIEGLEKLGVGEALPFTYPTVKSQISNSGTLDGEILLADTAYGQGEFLLNIVHLASIYGGVINNGNMMQPLLLEEESEKVWKENIVSEEQAKMLQISLRKIVTEGSSQKANIPGREMAGKTGTAEIKMEQGTTGTENGWFVSYDQQDPTMLTAMMIEGVEAKEPRGSTYTVEMTKRFYEALRVSQ